MKKLRYVCTTGPSMNDINIIEKLCILGLRIVRFNMSYRNKCMIEELLPQIQELNVNKNYNIETMVDLCGPEIRIDIENSLEIKKDCIYILGIDIKVKEGDISVLEKNDLLIFGDGEIKFKVIKNDNGLIRCISLDNGILKKNKKITNEKLCKTTQFISERDERDINDAIKYNVNYLCISFVNNVDDIKKVKVLTKNSKIKIIAKIETKEGFENLKDIIQFVDGVMIGRGDLGVRFDICKIGFIQKEICKIVKENNKKLIVGTGFLSSMKNSNIPTRAEVNDLYNTYLDGIDMIMFSGETASSISPENVLMTANKIVGNVVGR